MKQPEAVATLDIHVRIKHYNGGRRRSDHCFHRIAPQFQHIAPGVSGKGRYNCRRNCVGCAT